MSLQLHSLALILSLFFQAPAGQDVRTLEPGKAVEREIAGGQSHTYQISLTAGQFVRFRAEQRDIDVAFTLTAADGKQIAEKNLTLPPEEESLSFKATVAGSYRLTVRGGGAPTLHGSYRLDAALHAEATAQDHKRLTAEALLAEVNQLRSQGRKSAPQVVEKTLMALHLWRELSEQSRTVQSLFLIAATYYDLSQFEKATEYYEQALPIYRELKDKAGEGSALSNLGLAYKELGRYEKAVECYEQALGIEREVKNRLGEAQVLNNLATVLKGLGRTQKAVEDYEQALAIYREVKSRAGEGDALNNLGSIFNSLGRSDKAIEYLEQAQAIYREVKNRLGEALALSGMATAYKDQGLNEKAMDHLERALAIYREVKSRGGEAIALTGLGAISLNLGQNEQAIQYFESARAIHQETKNRRSEAMVLGNIGVVFIATGQTEKAIEHFEQALIIHRELKNRPSEGIMLNNLGSSYSRVNRYVIAIEYYRQALLVYREIKNRQGEANALINLGDAYNHLGQYPEAIDHLERGLALSREVKNPSTEAVALNNLGDTYAFSNRAEKAIDFYQQALALHRQVKNRREEGVTLTSLGNMQRSLGQPDKAAESGAQALAVLRGLEAPDLEVVALYALAKTERARGDVARSQALVEESLRIAESRRADLASMESRAAFLATVQSSYQLYTDILMSRNKAEPTDGFAAMAVEVSERQRARSLLDLLTEARVDLRQGVDAKLRERELSLAKQLNDKARAQTSKPDQAAALKQEISQLETEYERAQVAIKKANPHYANLTLPQPLKLKEIRAQLDPDTLLLEYSLGEERSYLWAITRDSLTSYELPKGEVIEKSARQVYELLTARSTNKRGESVAQRQERMTQAEAQLPAAARDLSQTILAPVAAHLGNKRLVVVADGALQYIPFAMLPAPSVVGGQSSVAKNNGQPLIVGHEVVSLPSASALAIQRSDLAGRQPAPKLLAVIADPVFDRSDKRFKTAATDAGSDKTPAQAITADDARSIGHLAENSVDKSGVTTPRMVIPRLPFTRLEATRLLALAPKNSSLSEIDFQANRENVLKGDLSQYRYVHFATHGLLDAERPGLSSLVLSMVDEKGQSQNGFLRANDIYNLKLPAELVVLSACQTGLGKEIKGEGLVGLTRGFMYAGAARVVVSLWSVNDKATAKLMTKFYEKMLKQGERPAEALRAAQVEMWRQKQWQSPYYWAAFTLQGEWR
jgi:CHAT domain-containing protein